MKKAQISVEYLIVLGITMVLLIGASYIFFQYSKSSSEKILKSEVNNIGNKIMTTAESVYSLGEGSMIRLELNFPDQISNVYIVGNSELVIRAEFSTGNTESVFFSDIPINGTINTAGPGVIPVSIGMVHPGINVINVKSKGSWVEINLIN
jgi:hypothetical protein